MDTRLETYLAMLEEGYYEAKFAFEGLADANVWKRPAPGLLSIGEIAGHMAFWEAARLANEEEGDTNETGEHRWPDPARFRVSSPLIDARFRYYSPSEETLPTDLQRAMTAEQVLRELLRVHAESSTYFKARNVAPEACPPGMLGWTWNASLGYLVFHTAYHVGQIYSARHLLGETPPDN